MKAGTIIFIFLLLWPGSQMTNVYSRNEQAFYLFLLKNISTNISSSFRKSTLLGESQLTSLINELYLSVTCLEKHKVVLTAGF